MTIRPSPDPPSNGRVAHVSLEGLVEAERFVKGGAG